MKDFSQWIKSGLAIGAAAQVLNTDRNGLAVDLAGVNACTFIASVVDVTADTYTVRIQESADGTTGWTDAPASVVVTTDAVLSADAEVVELGYRGYSRYVRLVINGDGTATTFGVYVLGHLGTSPA